MSTRHLEIKSVGTVTVARVLAPEFNAAVYPEISQRIFRLVDREGAKKLVLDFSGVRYLFSESLGILVSLNKRLRGSGCELRLCGLNEQQRELLETTNLEQLFSIHDDEQAALDGF